VVSIDQNGVATANQPGSVLISANVRRGQFRGLLLHLSAGVDHPHHARRGTTNPVVVNQNNPQPLQAGRPRHQGQPLTGLSLEYESTSPTTIPAGSMALTPILAGAASISASASRRTATLSAYNQIGLFGNGKPITSNSVNITAPGTNSTVLYMASTQSLYMEARDFTQPGAGAPFLLPYVPNSMVISNDGSTIYMGSSTALMVLNAVNTLSHVAHRSHLAGHRARRVAGRRQIVSAIRSSRSPRSKAPPAASSPPTAAWQPTPSFPGQPDRIHHRRQSVADLLRLHRLDQHHSRDIGRNSGDRRGHHGARRWSVLRRPHHHRARLLPVSTATTVAAPPPRPMSSIRRPTAPRQSPTASPPPTTACTSWAQP
jgi:hypothetical protein